MTEQQIHQLLAKIASNNGSTRTSTPRANATTRRTNATAKPNKKTGMHKCIFLAHVTGILIGIGFESGKLQAIITTVFQILVGAA